MTQICPRVQVCLLTRLAANDIIIVVSIVITLFLLVTVVYGYRWPLRLWLYEVCRGRHQRKRRQAERQLHRYKYDVFLAYAEEDMGWVQQELLPVLEEKWRLRVCVHQRDFVPGKHIVDNISDCVSESDRVLMVFSPHFADSQWCQFELKFCQICIMERDDVLVLVKLKDTEARTMTGAMLAVLLTTTYIEWEDEERARRSFWGRLEFALNDVIQTGR